MKRSTPLLSVIVATLVVAHADRPVRADDSTASIPNATAVVTLKDFDFFTTFQNPVGVAVDEEKNVKIGILFTGEILKVRPDGKVSNFAQLPIVNPVPDPPVCPLRPDPPPSPQIRSAFMTGFALHHSGDLYVGLPTCNPDTHGIWRVSEDGSTAELFASLPVADLPKGLAFSNGKFPLYVSNLHDFRPEKSRENCAEALETPSPDDDCTLKVWRINKNGKVMTWAESALFFGSPDSPLDHPHGINGIVVDKAEENVYGTVTDFGRVVRIPIKSNGQAGRIEVVFESEPDKPAEQRELFGIDGITIGPDGNFYIVVVRTDQLVAIHPGERTHTVIVDGHPLDGPTQLAFVPHGDDDDDYKDGSKRLPPLYITSGSGRRIFLYNGALFLGEGSVLSGASELVDMEVITEEQAVDLQPRPSVVRVLLD